LWDATEEVFFPLWDTTEEFFFVGYNGEGFPPLWDPPEKVFSIVGYNEEKGYNAE
jgi:hypothetical protein